MTDRYAVVGNPLSHSKSPQIHMSFAKASEQDLEYGTIEAPVDSFKASVEAFRQAGGKGINITAPFKLEAFAFATRKMPRAEYAGATNCLKFENDEIIAENFDGIGLVNDIQRNLGFSLAGKRVLMLGAGGAARGAAIPILEAGPASLTIVNRTRATAEALQAAFVHAGPIRAGGFTDLGSEAYDIVLNATSASLRGELPMITGSIFNPDCLAYELAYGKGLTPFLALARSQGARLADGVGMLVEQAAEAFEWWRGIRPETGSVIEMIRVPIA